MSAGSKTYEFLRMQKLEVQEYTGCTLKLTLFSRRSYQSV